MPYAFWVSRMCEEFGCLPSQIEAEIKRLPVGFLDEVLEARRFAELKAAYDRDPEKVAQEGLGALVYEIDFDLAEIAKAEIDNG